MPSRSMANSVRAERHARLARGHGRPAENALFQSLVNDDEPILVPVERLDPVAALVAKDEDVSRQRVIVQVLAYLLGQPVEAAA